eukprot:11551-Eustigmatos_ZCMA.PRE.1
MAMWLDLQFAQPENLLIVLPDASARKRRIKAGGKRKKMYVEAWLEYQNKKDASFVAKNVNGTLVGE